MIFAFFFFNDIDDNNYGNNFHLNEAMNTANLAYVSSS